MNPNPDRMAQALNEICAIDRATVAYAAERGGADCLVFATAATRRLLAVLEAEQAALQIPGER